jgi:phosphoglycolate phosphatase
MDTRLDADLIIFDLDGTLIDSSEDIAWAANMVLRSMGHEEAGLEAIKEGVGWGAKALLERLMPDEGPEAITRARERFIEFYLMRPAVNTYAYPGVAETIGELKAMDKLLAVVTNKPAALAGVILGALGLREPFSMVIGGDSFPNRKPHPEPLEKVMEALGGRSDSTVIVGDSPIDCEAGKRAGIMTIGVSYGFRGADELAIAGCDKIIGRFDELIGLLKR